MNTSDTSYQTAGDDHSYSIGRLAELAETTPRTIRYYTSEGLLPAPEASGKYARYTDTHLERLRLIARLKAAYLPLNQIRDRIGPLTPNEVRAMLDDLDHSQQHRIAETSSAAEYIAHVVARQRVARPPGTGEPQMLAPIASPAPPSAQPRIGFARGLAAGEAPEGEGERWRRITLTPDMELHVREPSDQATAALVARIRKLIEAAE